MKPDGRPQDLKLLIFQKKVIEANCAPKSFTVSCYNPSPTLALCIIESFLPALGICTFDAIRLLGKTSTEGLQNSKGLKVNEPRTQDLLYF